VQIAKAFGADVTGVCSTRNVDMVRSILADHVIDNTREDLTRSGQRYDFARRRATAARCPAEEARQGSGLFGPRGTGALPCGSS
jgi:NADPH:quinone reductase-like Zn-dependent oxidoreductase